MSLINKVLRDLDRRSAIPGNDNAASNVRVVAGKRSGPEWFWRTVSLLVFCALGWIGWVVYQIQPRPIATELAEQAAQQAQARVRAPKAIAKAEPKPAPVTAPPAAEPPVAAETPKPAPQPVAEPAKPAPAPVVVAASVPAT